MLALAVGLVPAQDFPDRQILFSVNPTCAADDACRWRNHHIVTRLWTVNDPEAYSAQQVA